VRNLCIFNENSLNIIIPLFKISIDLTFMLQSDYEVFKQKLSLISGNLFKIL
jgi:hypothetical protein